MLDTVNLGAFIIAGLLLNITPGADLLYIAGKSATGGSRAGMVAALGIGVGCLVHIAFAAFGLSVILATSATAFTIVKLLGAGYLIYLGITALLSGKKKANPEQEIVKRSRTEGSLRIFSQAILINILNPKVALFFLAFLPQFVAPEAKHPALSFLFLGAIFNVNGTIINLLFARAAADVAMNLKRFGNVAKVLNKAVGLLFIGLGIRLAQSVQK